MNRIRLLSSLVLTCSAILCPLEPSFGASDSGQSGISMVFREPWSDVFSGKEAVFHVNVTGTAPFHGTVGWQCVVDGRTLARGEQLVEAPAVSPGTLTIRLAVPEVKAGVILQARLSVVTMDSGKETGRTDKVLWIFPGDAIAGHEAWLKGLDIRLFDPVGRTSKLFDENKIPCTLLRNVDAFSGVRKGILVIGEGVSFREYRGLADMLFKSASKGGRVLCLTPDGGEMTLPVTGEGEMLQPDRLMFRQADIVTELDKRLDPRGWQTSKVMESGLRLRGDRGPVVAETCVGKGAWPWMELDYAAVNGKLVVCGFGIVNVWAESPTPRFLLMKVLERVSGNKMKEEKE